MCKALSLLLSRAYYFSKINQPPIAYNLSNESSHDKLKNRSYPDRTHTHRRHTPPQLISQAERKWHTSIIMTKRPLPLNTDFKREHYCRERRPSPERDESAWKGSSLCTLHYISRLDFLNREDQADMPLHRVIGGTLGLIKCKSEIN